MVKTIQTKDGGTVNTYYIDVAQAPGAIIGTRVQDGQRPQNNRLWVQAAPGTEAKTMEALGLLPADAPKPADGPVFEIGNPQYFVDHWAQVVRATYVIASSRTTATVESWATCQRVCEANPNAKLISIQVP